MLAYSHATFSMESACVFDNVPKLSDGEGIGEALCKL
jgi:hypothetical protein